MSNEFKDWLLDANPSDILHGYHSAIEAGNPIVIDLYRTELDRRDIPYKEVGQKFDQEKVEVAEFMSQFPNAIVGLSIVAQYGKNKYSEGNGNVNFKEVPNATKRYKDGLMRHTMSYLSGEFDDTESTLPHLYHMFWNIGALIELAVDDSIIDINDTIQNMWAKKPKVDNTIYS